MSSNLIKQIFTVVQDEEKRVIDTNELSQRRIEKFSGKNQTAAGGFVSGLAAEEVELPEGSEAGETPGNNVIKAGEDANLIRERAGEEAEQLLAEAKLQAEQLMEDARAQAEVTKEQIFAEAKKQGYADGHVQAQEETEVIRREYAEKEKQLEKFYQKQLDEMEPQLVDTITDIYQHIFHVELRSYQEILGHLISSTLRKIEGGRDFMVHVSKEDYPYVSMQKKQILTGAVSAVSNVEVIEDMTLTKNQCLIETEGSIFDCGLGTQLGELKQKLMLLAWTKED